MVSTSFIVGKHSPASEDEARPIRVLCVATSQYEALCLSFHPNGEYVILGGQDGRVVVYDHIRGRIVRYLYTHNGPVSDLSSTWLGDKVYSCSCGYKNSSDCELAAWDLFLDKRLFIKKIDEKKCYCLAVSYDGQIALTGKARDIVCYDATTGNKLRLFATQDEDSRAMCFTPNGMFFSGGINGAIIEWDRLAGVQQRVVARAEHFVSSMNCSADGRFFSFSNSLVFRANGILTDRMHFLNYAGHVVPKTGYVVVKEINPPGKQYLLPGKSDEVTNVRFAKDGKSLYYSDGNSIMNWAIGNGQEPQCIGTHEATVRAIAVAPDSSCLVSLDTKNVLKVWAFPQAERGRKRTHVDSHKLHK